MKRMLGLFPGWSSEVEEAATAIVSRDAKGSLGDMADAPRGGSTQPRPAAHRAYARTPDWTEWDWSCVLCVRSGGKNSSDTGVTVG